MPSKKPHSPADLRPLSVEVIERRIYLIRGYKVMLDGHLAELYGVKSNCTSPAGEAQPDAFP